MRLFSARYSPLATHLSLAACLAFLPSFVNGDQKAAAAEPPVDQTHAAHVASGAMPPDAAKGDAAVAQQLGQLQAKVTQLEAALAAKAPGLTATSGPSPAAMPAMPASAAPMAGMSSGTQSAQPARAMARMPMQAPPMAGMSTGSPSEMKPAVPIDGMGASPGGSPNMMGMMDKMMGMMDKMMSMGGAPMGPAAPMATGGMAMMQGEMAGRADGAAMPTAPAPAGMSGGGMAMGGMPMAEMMGMSAMPAAAPGAMPTSMLPGFAGASHLYHIGATGFFLDHPTHIALTTDQQAALNQVKEAALLTKNTAARAIAQAEQDLWTLTAADRPDEMAITAKIAEIGKLTGDERLAFIRSVGNACALLTDQQRQALTGFAPPAPAMPSPAMSSGVQPAASAAAMPGGMGDM